MTGFWDDAVGRSAAHEHVFTRADIVAYTALTGETATDTVPSPLLAGMISRLLGRDLPGPGSLYLDQELSLPDTVVVGETVRASVTVTEIRPHKSLITLHTVADVGDRAVLRGTALVMARQFPYHPSPESLGATS